MVLVRDIETVEREKGVASTVKVDDFKVQYAEGVEKFIRDNSSLGDAWQRDVARRLYNFQGRDQEGNVLGSSSEMSTAVSMFCPEIQPIKGKQFLNLYKKMGNKNPFGNVYVEFGVALTPEQGSYNINRVQAKALSDQFKLHGIPLEQGLVPDFCQLVLSPDMDSGLVFKLAGDVKKGEVPSIGDYPFGNYIGKNGLFGACVDRSDWNANNENLANSNDNGLMA